MLINPCNPMTGHGSPTGDAKARSRWHVPLLYLRTVRHLRLRQVVARVYQKVYRPRLYRSALPRKRVQTQPLTEVRRRARTMLDLDVFCFLNKVGQIARPEDWNDRQRDKLWLYNLHYFDDLVAESVDCREPARTGHRVGTVSYVHPYRELDQMGPIIFGYGSSRPRKPGAATSLASP